VTINLDDQDAHTGYKIQYRDTAGGAVVKEIDYETANFESFSTNTDGQFYVSKDNDGSKIIIMSNGNMNNLSHSNFGVWHDASPAVERSSSYTGGELTANMPTSGDVTFVGAYAGVEKSSAGVARASFTGSSTIDANFATNKITNLDMTATEMTNYNGYTSSQSDYNISATDIDISSANAEFSGVFSNANFKGAMAGHFYGESAAEIGGTIAAIRNDGSDNEVNASFGATR
jgi:hypothetical protein